MVWTGLNCFFRPIKRHWTSSGSKVVIFWRVFKDVYWVFRCRAAEQTQTTRAWHRNSPVQWILDYWMILKKISFHFHLYCSFVVFFYTSLALDADRQMFRNSRQKPKKNIRMMRGVCDGYNSRDRYRGSNTRIQLKRPTEQNRKDKFTFRPDHERNPKHWLHIIMQTFIVAYAFMCIYRNSNFTAFTWNYFTNKFRLIYIYKNVYIFLQTC